jgi:putative membrane protein
MLAFIVRIFLNAALLYIVAALIPGITFPAPSELSAWTALWVYARVGVAIALVNALVTPLLKLLFFPLILITFGLASGLLNIFTLWLLAFLLPSFEVSSFMGLIYGTIVFSIGNMLIDWLTP